MGIDISWKCLLGKDNKVLISFLSSNFDNTLEVVVPLEVDIQVVDSF